MSGTFRDPGSQQGQGIPGRKDGAGASNIPVNQGPGGTQFPPGSGPYGSGQPAPRRRRGRRAALFSVVAVLVLVGGTITGANLMASHFGGNVHRIPNALHGVTGNMPASERGSMTVLLAGADIRSRQRTTGTGAHKMSFQPGLQRSDILMLVHVDANRKQASFISIPRDSWVHVPGHGMLKINAALSLGGPSLMVRTVESLTHVRIDHYAFVGFQGFDHLVNSLGGVQVRVAHATSSGDVHFRQGTNDLTGSSALTYVRQRLGLPLGDLSRVQRQQNLIRAIFTKVASEHVFTNPVRLYNILNVFTHAFSVDSTFTNASMVRLALQLSRLRGSNVTYLTAPWKGLGTQSGQSVVYLNKHQCTSLWQAVRNDSVAAWAKQHPGTVTPVVPS